MENHWENDSRRAVILSVGGGKGGSGKSFFSSNLGILLAQSGKKVLMLDLDIGAANLHTCLGVPLPERNLGDFFESPANTLESLIQETYIPNLSFVGGGREFWQQVQLQSVHKIRLISKLQKMPVDYVMIDLGAGTHTNTQDFFIFSHMGLVVVTPEPTSIENAYVFIKAIVVRRIQTILKSLRMEEQGKNLLNQLQDPHLKTSIKDLLEEFCQNHHDIGKRILWLVNHTCLGIVMNQVRIESDTIIGERMCNVCKNYFGLDCVFLGGISYNDDVWKAIRGRKPLSLLKPQSQTTLDITSISKSLHASFFEDPLFQTQKEV